MSQWIVVERECLQLVEVHATLSRLASVGHNGPAPVEEPAIYRKPAIFLPTVDKSFGIAGL